MHQNDIYLPHERSGESAHSHDEISGWTFISLPFHYFFLFVFRKKNRLIFVLQNSVHSLLPENNWDKKRYFPKSITWIIRLLKI